MEEEKKLAHLEREKKDAHMQKVKKCAFRGGEEEVFPNRIRTSDPLFFLPLNKNNPERIVLPLMTISSLGVTSSIFRVLTGWEWQR